MNKAILKSVSPNRCEQIASGECTILLSKTAPKLETPFKCYIYMTKNPQRLIEVLHKGDDVYGMEYTDDKPTFIKIDKHSLVATPLYGKTQKVIGEFVCDKVEQFTVGSLRCDDIEKSACLSYEEIIKYFYKPNEIDGKTVKFGYGLHISQLKIYDKPKELGEFWKIDKCPYVSDNGCTYNYYCFRAGENRHKNGRCGEKITRPPQSWCYVEELEV